MSGSDESCGLSVVAVVVGGFGETRKRERRRVLVAEDGKEKGREERFAFFFFLLTCLAAVRWVSWFVVGDRKRGGG